MFCRVIDNFGDLGVCWRLCADLAARGHTVRLWVDDASALQWMAPGALDDTWPGVQVLGWEESADTATLASLSPADVWIEGFGCEIATEFIAAYAHSTRAAGHKHCKPPVWINLEYLSAESYVERSHGLASPVMHGPAKGWSKHFFYPGFTARTGGLLREPNLLARQHAFASSNRVAWLQQHGITTQPGERWVSLFCYEPPALVPMLAQLAQLPGPTRLLVTAGRATAAVRAALSDQAEHQPINKNGLQPSWNGREQLSISYLPTLTQPDFDHLLWACDLNFVRGEDSLVRALWAGKPMVWHIYPQDDGAHGPKLDAFLDAIDALASLRNFHYAWNGLHPLGESSTLPAIDLQAWSRTLLAAREQLLQMDDLTTQLVHFVQKKR